VSVPHQTIRKETKTIPEKRSEDFKAETFITNNQKNKKPNDTTDRG